MQRAVEMGAQAGAAAVLYIVQRGSGTWRGIHTASVSRVSAVAGVCFYLESGPRGYPPELRRC